MSKLKINFYEIGYKTQETERIITQEKDAK